MMLRKRLYALLLAAALVFSLCACGSESGPYRIIATVGEKQYGFQCRSGDRLFEQFGAAMQSLAADGALSAASLTWLGTDNICLEGDAGAVGALTSPPEARDVIVGVQSECMPLSYPDGDTYVGMNVDIANAVGRLYGWTIRIQPIRAGDVATQLAAGNIDVALGFDASTGNTSAYAAGACYMKSSILVVAPVGSDIDSVRALREQRIGSIKDPSILSAVQANDKFAKYDVAVTQYLSPARCVSALNHGWCVAVAMDSIMLDAYFQ